MKKIFALMLALCAAVSISACNKTAPKDADTTADKAAEAPAATDTVCDASKCGDGKCDCKDAGDGCKCDGKDGGECKCGKEGGEHKCGEGCKCGCKESGECKCNHHHENNEAEAAKEDEKCVGDDCADEVDAECKTDEECAAKTGDDYSGNRCIEGNERSTFCGCDDDDDCKEGYKCDDKLCVKG